MTSTRDDACSRVSLDLGEPLAGSAAPAGGYVLLEHGGPWQARAVEGLGAHGQDLVDRLKPAGVTPLLVRRHRATPGPAGRPRVGLVAVTATGGAGAWMRVDRLDDVTRWDVPALLDDLRDGRLPDGATAMGTTYLVCTNGRRDVCCAELGRPLAAVLTGLAPDDTWEVTHLGGHRFAATALVVPDGLAYGRLVPDDALDVVTAHAQGRLLVEHLRGRAALAPAGQVAEVALRRALHDRHPTPDQRDAVRLTATCTHDVPDGGGTAEGTRTQTHWAVGDRTWRVVVDTVPGSGAPRPASCGAEAAPEPARHVVVEVTDVEDAGRGAAGWDDAHAASVADTAPNPLVVAEVEDLPAGSALDVACGLGRHARWLAARGWRVTGTDFSRTGLARAADLARDEGLDVDWLLGDVRSLDLPEHDLVVLAFAHVPDVARRALRWLRPGGRLVLVGHALRNLAEGVGGPQDPRLLHDPTALRRDCEDADLEVLRCEEVERQTGDGVAVDAVLVARRPA
ncbi:sucrase ferredoxin [Thalassiella azotivora]